MDGKESDCIDRNQAGNMMNSGSEQSTNGLDDLTPEQLAILHEKMELEKLLEVTKNLQQQANLFFSTKETSSPPPSAPRQQKKLNASESSEIRGSSRLQCSSNSDDLSQSTEANSSTTVTSEPQPKRRADKTEGAKVQSTKHGAVFEYSDSDGSRDPLSLLGNARLLEENAELLQKKIELEVLLHRAKILLERSGLLEANDNAGGSEEFSTENNVEQISQTHSTPDSNVQTLVDDNSGTVYNNDNNDIEEYSERNQEAFYEKASELASKTKSLLDVVHQNKEPCSNKSPEENTNCSTLNFDLKHASHDAPTGKASDHVSESETRSSIDESEKEHVEMTANNNNNQTEVYDKDTIQRLLQKADLLLEQKFRSRWSAEDPSKEVISDKGFQGLSVKQDSKEAASTQENEENKQTRNDDVGAAAAADKANGETEVLYTIVNEESSIAARLGQELSKVIDQSDESTDEDDDDDEDDDPSFDAKLHLQQLLQRARTVLERSKIPARERLLEHEGLGESQPTENTSDPSVSETESLNSENKSGALNSAEKLPEKYEAVSLEKPGAAQATDASETDFDALTQDAQLDFLIRTTSDLKRKADSLINQISDPENPSNIKSTQEDHEGATNGHGTTERTVNAKQDSPITTPLDRTANEAIGENFQSGIFETAEFRPDVEGCQAEYEEVEESQLQINETDKSPLEIEDEYASDGSDVCDMMQYYEEDNESSSEAGEETDLSETQTDGIEAELRQLQKVTDLLVETSEFANEMLNTRQPQDNSTSENEYLRPIVSIICNSHNEQENLACQLQQAPDAVNYISASSETEFLGRTGDASLAPVDQDDTAGDLANEDGAFDERAELRLLLEKTKLLLEKAKQPLDAEEIETETGANVCPDGDINPLKHTDSTTNEASALKSDEIKEISSSTNQAISTVDTEAKTFDLAGINHPQGCDRSPENAAENTLVSEEQSSPCELQVISSVLLSESEEFADKQVLCSVEEHETLPASVFNADDVNRQDRIMSVADSSDLLSAQLTQIKAEINTILQEASAEATDSLGTRTDLESSSNCDDAAKPRRHDRSEEEPKIPDTSCSGHSISKGVDVSAADQQRVCETDAESSHTGTGVPETDAVQTNGAKTGEHSDSKPISLNSLSGLTKLLSLQKDMARMQLHLSNLQDSMRTTNATLQELLDEAFSEM